MISFDEIDQHCEQYDTTWLELCNNAKPILYYNGEGSLLYLLNTYRIEDYIVNNLNDKNKDKAIFEHTDEYWNYYYPELRHDNGPDIRVIDNYGVYYYEVKHFYDKNKFERTKDFYSITYKEGILKAKEKYPTYYTCDYREKGYNTTTMIFVLVEGDKLIFDFMDIATGEIITSATKDNNIKLWRIPESCHL